MPSSYRITEPHPTISTPYIYSGRGGAGNFSHINPKNLTSGPDASGPASRTKLPSSTAGKNGSSAASSPSNNYYPSGRGGAGNMHSCSYFSERPMFSFDEELERQKQIQEHMAPHYHVGRGGAGNLQGSTGQPDRRSSAASVSGSSSGSSISSGNSVRGGGLGETWNRLKGSFAK